jgi:hypothetical protein
MRVVLVACFAIAIAAGAYLITAPQDTVAQSCAVTNTCP